jgi:hypothetical protein
MYRAASYYVWNDGLQTIKSEYTIVLVQASKLKAKMIRELLILILVSPFKLTSTCINGWER